MRTVHSAKSITNRSFLLYALCSFLPYIAFLLYLFLQLHDSIPEGFRSRRTTRDEYVHGFNILVGLASHDQQIGLPRVRKRHIAEHIEVMLRSAQELDHLDTTARKTERERPYRTSSHIIQELIDLRGNKSFFKPVLNYSHSSAPFFHA